jgi:hypothetical protein
MIDISEGGICFISSQYLSPGTFLDIDLGPCRILAEVRHCRLREYGSDSQFVTGVQIKQVLEGAEAWRALTESAG